MERRLFPIHVVRRNDDAAFYAADQATPVKLSTGLESRNMIMTSLCHWSLHPVHSSAFWCMCRLHFNFVRFKIHFARKSVFAQNIRRVGLSLKGRKRVLSNSLFGFQMTSPAFYEPAFLIVVACGVSSSVELLWLGAQKDRNSGGSLEWGGWTSSKVDEIPPVFSF